MLRFDSFGIAEKTICGIEIMHMVRGGGLKNCKT